MIVMCVRECVCMCVAQAQLSCYIDNGVCKPAELVSIGMRSSSADSATLANEPLCNSCTSIGSDTSNVSSAGLSWTSSSWMESGPGLLDSLRTSPRSSNSDEQLISPGAGKL